MADKRSPDQENRNSTLANTVKGASRDATLSRNIDGQVRKALDLHRSGKLGEAEGIYREVLVLDQNHVQANLLLGILYYQTERFEQAIISYQKTLELKPDFIDAYSNLGLAQKSAGRKTEAITSFTRALELNPNLAPLHSNLGNTYRELGQTDAAVSSYRQAISLDPNVAEYHNNLGNALSDLGRLDEAVSCFMKSVELKSNMPGVYLNLGSSLARLDRLEEAVQVYRKALSMAPVTVEIHTRLGNALSDLGRMDEAVESYRAAIRLKSDCVEAINGMGLALRDLGQMDGAIAAFKQAIAIQPDYTRAHANLAQMRVHKQPDGEIEAMNRLYERSDLNAEQRADLAFGLARAYENIGHYPRSFELILQGKRLQQTTFAFDINKTDRLFTSIQENYSAGFLEGNSKAGFEDETPIFILGMPRSGTSLVEQILASHSRVYGAGELKMVGELGRRLEKATGKRFPVTDSQMDQRLLRELGASYVDALRQYSQQARFITDKMPANFLYIGLIAVLLPGARIIHCVRDPMDTCFSIFKSQFSESHHYANSLDDLGRYYLHYERLMAHWNRVLPGRIFNLQYEELVQDSEAVINKILAYCDLPFEPACLSFHKTTRTVKTASAVQVRQPVYQHAVNFWKNYQHQLQPLKEILDAQR